MPDDSPIFICGALRSGTTMLRLMIDSHPELSNFGEADYLFEYPHTSGRHPNVAAFKHQLARNGLFADAGLSIPDADNVHSFIRALVSQMRIPNKALTVNLHRNFERIPATFPDSKIIHLLRDPRDVARSSIGMGWSGNVYHGVDHWIASERSMEALRNAFPRTEILTIRNEDLVADPEVALTRVCAFIGAPYDPKMLDYHLTSTYAPPDKSLVEQWRTKLSERELGLVEGKVGALLSERGYPPSGAPLVVPGEAEIRRLERQNRWGRLRETVRRYGLWLTVLEIVGRRTGIEPVHEFARRRINDKHKLFLK